MKNLFFIPFLILALILGLFSQKSFAQETKSEKKSSKKIKIKIKTNNNGEEKNFEWSGKDNEEMPEDVKKQLNELKLDGDIKNIDIDMGNDSKIILKNFKGNVGENFDKNIRIDMENLSKDLEKQLGSLKFETENLSFLCDSMQKNCKIKIFGNMDGFKGFDNMEFFENNDNLKEGTTEKTKEIDLGDGKKATITTKRTVVIKKDKKSKKQNIENTLEAENINVFPNPNDGNFTLEMDKKDKSNAKISVINPNGKIIFENTLKNVVGKYSQKINLPETLAGMYILKVEQNGKIITKKIIVE
ncbi:MAG: T9SS C-terminal target domain-containing protein [Bacteroidetes bacterium]|nr:MAG: T9SS C-terminal target domain-containing protein [Bacteroidota bacterium]